MSSTHREQGETRKQMLTLLRHHQQLSAGELAALVTISPVGARQHLALLERDGLVCVAGVRPTPGRPCQLYQLTPLANSLFPRCYERISHDALELLHELGGEPLVDTLFLKRQARLRQEIAPHLAGKPLHERLTVLLELLNQQGYMCECQSAEPGGIVFTQHNCPIEAVARDFPQACQQELVLYEEMLGTPLARDETIAAGGMCCRYRINKSR